MTSLFSSPKVPAPPVAAAPAPTSSTADVQAAANDQRARQANAQGTASTLLTPVDTQPTQVPTKTLLGSG